MTQKNPTKRSFLSFMGLAFEMLATILLGTFLGRYFDKKINIPFPIATITGIFLGIGIAFYRIFKTLKSTQF